MLESLWFDLKYACRVLRRTPRTSFIAIAILASAIGVNTAMFSAVNHVFFRPFPFADADRLVRVRDQITAGGERHAFNMSARHVLALRAHTGAFDGIVAFSGDSMTLTTADVPERVSVVLQNDNGADTLGVAPIVGRRFTADEQALGAPADVAIIGHAAWMAHFGGSPDVVGRTVMLNGRRFSIVGVMPPAYAFPYNAQFWIPIGLDPGDREHDFAVFCRMRAGVAFEQVGEALTAAARAIADESAPMSGVYGLELMTIRENLVGPQAAPLQALTEIVGFLMLVGCVNVAILLLGRAAARRREMAIRSALGASGARQVRQLAAEGLVLAAAGGGAGLLLAGWFAPLTRSLVPTVVSEQLGLATPTLDYRVFAFAAAASAVSALAATVLPAIAAGSTEPAAALAEEGRGSSGGAVRSRSLGWLIVGETALTVVLLGGAGLVIRQFVVLQTMPLGFDAHGLLTTEVDLPSEGYPAVAERTALLQSIVERLRTLPGVSGAAATTVNPLGGGTWATAVTSEDLVARDPAAAINANYRLVTPGLLETMRIPLLRGRPFTDQDRAGSTPVAIVSDRLARRLWPGADPIGKRLRIARAVAPWVAVVGVAGDVDDAHDAGVPHETWYLPFAQNADQAAAAHVYLMVRGSGDILALVTPIRRAVAALDPTHAVYGAAAMDGYHSASLVRERTGALFMFVFALLGVALAALGVYGVLAFTIAQRTMEIGIRMAMGAAAGDILPLVLGRAARLIAAGIGAGVFGAVALNRVLATVLPAIASLDVPVLLSACGVVLATAATASVVPALAAARLDPAAALRGVGSAGCVSHRF